MHSHRERPTGVRPDWLRTVVGAVQIAGGRASIATNVQDARGIFEQFIRTLPAPEHPVEHLMLDGLLLQCAFRFGAAVHAGVHRKRTLRCAFSPAPLVERAWAAGAANGREAFAVWARIFCDEFSRTHPTSIAQQAALLVRERFSERWRVDVLARRCHATPSRLRQEFREEFGMSIREYQQVVRMMRGLERVITEKVEAVAYAVGYRSKKNFYRAFQKVTGLRLDAYRRLPPEGSAEVREAVMRLLKAQ